MGWISRITEHSVYWKVELGSLLFPLLSSIVILGAAAAPMEAQVFEPNSALSFTMVQGGTSPLPQILPVAAANNSNFYFSGTATTSSGGTWLTVSSAQLYTPASLLVSVNNNVASTLAPGTYSGQVKVTANSVSETVGVTLNVVTAAQPSFVNLPGGLTYALATGGGAGTQVIQINNAGGGTLYWTLTANTFNSSNFLTVSAPSGTAPSMVTISVAQQNLPGGGLTTGTFTGQLVFSSSSGAVTIPVAVTVGGTSFAQSAPLSFSMPVSGAAPLPQVIPGTSSSSGFYFTASAYSTTGGNWLTVTSGSFYTPGSPLIGVDQTVAAALPAGVYTGEVILSASGNAEAPPMAVPVTLTISPSNVPFFDNIPGGMNFYLPAHGASPGTQTFQVRNAGSGALNWSATTSTGDGGNWLSVSPSSGTAPSLVSVQIAAQNLPGGGAAGSYSGNILFRSGGSTVTVPITVSVGVTAFLPVTPLSAAMPLNGAAPVDQAAAISSTFSGFYANSAAYTATGGNWLTVSSGRELYTPDSVEIGFNQTVVSALPAGTYTGEVVVSPASVNEASSMTIGVTLTVSASGTAFFGDFPGGLQFSLPAHGGSPGSQVIQVRNAGSGTLNWTVAATTADGGQWLTVSPNSGVASTLVTVGVLSQNLPGGAAAGIYNGTVLFESVSGTASVPITVTVGETGFVQIDPLSFNMPLNGAAPLPQAIPVSSISSGFYFNVSTSTATGGNWLIVTPFGSSIYTPDALTVSVNQSVASALPAGTYTGEVILVPSSDNTAGPTTVPVTLTVSPASAASFDNLPGGLQFALQAQGANPASQTFQVRNAGAGTLNWTVTASTADGGNWLTASANQGTAPSFLSVGVVSANLPGGAAKGTYSGTLLFQSGAETVSVPITVSVALPSLAQVNPLSFTMPFQGNVPLPQEVAIETLTGSGYYLNISALSATGGNWLKVSPTGTSIYPPQSLTVSVDQAVASALPAGTYTAEITLTPASSNNSAAPLTIPVTLSVAGTGTAFFDNLTGGLYFSALPSTATLAPQTISVRNAGTGQLNWTASPATSDGGNWLTLSSTTGTAPASTNLVVGVVAQNLPGQGAVAGTYTGQILFQSVNGSVTVPVTVVIGTTAFVESGGLTFNVPPGPSSQTLTIAEIGGGSVDLTATAFTGNGGTWLALSPNGSTSAPRAFTFTVSSGLPSGTYTGEALFVPSNGTAGQAIQITLNVTGPPPATITPVSGTPQSAVVQNAFASPFIAVVKDSTGAVVPGVTVIFTAPSSAASGKFPGAQLTATVTTDASGNATSPIFTANDIQGSYTVTAAVSGVALPANFSLTNKPPSLQSIAITAPSTSVVKGQTDQFTATGTYSDGSTANITSQVTWSSSNTATASINASGLATALAVGTTDVSASLNSITSNTVTLTVTNPTLQSIAISSPSTSIVRGNTDQFTATGTYSDGSTANITSQVAWSSSNTATASINSSGLAAALAVGTTNITASLSGITSNTITLTVTNPTLRSIAITAPNTSVVKSNTDQFAATGTYSDGSTANITTQVAWSSSNTATASINSSGLASALAVGTTNITASLSGITSNTITLTVTNPTLRSIAITAPNTSVVKGNTDQFTATGTYSDSSTANITSQVAWSSSTTATATINASGLATGLAAGTTNITASLSSITSNTITLTVTNPTLRSIAITAPSTSVVKGNTDQFTATGTYSDGSTANITSQVAWSSSNTATASINASGLATALAAGTTNITASLSGVTSNTFLLTVTQPAGPTVVSYSVLFGSENYNMAGTSRNRLPWQITGIRVVFSEAITSANVNSLSGIAPTSFSGLGTNTLTWTLSPISIGAFSTSLAGSGPNALTDVNGSPLNNGTGFTQHLKVLWGDFNDDGYVTSADMVGVNNSTAGSYNILADINGDGVVNLTDVQAARSRLGTSQP